MRKDTVSLTSAHEVFMSGDIKRANAARFNDAKTRLIELLKLSGADERTGILYLYNGTTEALGEFMSVLFGVKA